MRTDELIDALVADAGTKLRPLQLTVALALAIGATAAAVLFFALIGFRPDIAQAAETVRFPFKFVVVLSAAIPACGLSLRLAHPEAWIGRWGWTLALAPALLILGVGVELLSVPSAMWGTRLIGTNIRYCLTIIPMLAALPLAALLFALRDGASTRPRLTGAMAGLGAASIAAFLYASHCTDDSPLFVATWYPIAIGSVILIGSLLGSRVLRW
jgi:hypothetical protein